MPYTGGINFYNLPGTRRFCCFFIQVMIDWADLDSIIRSNFHEIKVFLVQHFHQSLLLYSSCKHEEHSIQLPTFTRFPDIQPLDHIQGITGKGNPIPLPWFHGQAWHNTACFSVRIIRGLSHLPVLAHLLGQTEMFVQVILNLAFLVSVSTPTTSKIFGWSIALV